MKQIWMTAFAGLLASMSFGLPNTAVAQQELGPCGGAPKSGAFPCFVGDTVARNVEEFGVLQLLRSGRATTPQQARNILRREAETAQMPNCGTKVGNSTYPCKIRKFRVNNPQDFRAFGLIQRGKAKTRKEALAILKKRDGARADAPVPACAATAKASRIPCTMGRLNVTTRADWAPFRLIAQGKASNLAEARALLGAARAPAPAIPACSGSANATPLPCKMGQMTVKSKEDWRVVRLITSGKAKDRKQARRLLAAQDAARNAPPKRAPACKGSAGKAAVPCQVGERVARSAEEIRIFRLIETGSARSIAEAQDQLARQRAVARREAEAKDAARKALRLERRRARRQAERAAAAAAAAANQAPDATSQTVTGRDVRASDEEFASSGNSGGGLSKFEKALLLGLGAVVVGKVLKNGDKVISNSGDRVVVESPEGDLRVLKDDDALIQRPGDQVQSRTYDDGSTHTMVTKPDGSRIITVRSADGAVLRRVNIDPGGTPTVVIDDTRDEQAVVVSELPPVIDGARQASLLQTDADLLQALSASLRASDARRFSLRQVREISEVRALAPQLELDAIRFASGSAAIQPEQARALVRIGTSMREMIAANPHTVILVEGHTDATGSATYNLALSDRRAETVALALTEYFDVPAQNMVTQGYGEDALKVPTQVAEAANRRAVVRNITGLLR